MPQEQHRATARVLDILERLASADGEGSTLTELAQALDAPKSSLFPILHTLEGRRYIRLERRTGQYYIGPGAYVLGAAFADGRGLDPIARVMKDLVDQCEETCQLGILDQEKVLYVEKVESPQAIRMISRVGDRLPANATALGKALLSGLTDQQVRALYPNGLPCLTEETVTDLETLLAQLESVRAQGVAMEREEATPQLACWAVPLRRQGAVFAALSVSAPLFRCTSEKEGLVCGLLLDAQREIEQLAETRGFTLL